MRAVKKEKHSPVNGAGNGHMGLYYKNILYVKYNNGVARLRNEKLSRV